MHLTKANHMIRLLIIACLFSQYQSGYHLSDKNETTSLNTAYSAAIERITQKARTEECKKKLEDAFGLFWNPLMYETTYPFERTAYFSECKNPPRSALNPVKFISDSPYERPKPVNVSRREEGRLNPADLGILYVMLVHSYPEFAIRVVEALQEPMHTFVLHVDTKSPETYTILSRYVSETRNQNVFLLPDEQRVSVAWGGFSIVNATLNGMAYGMKLGRWFDYVIDLSGTTYPIKSNQHIREYLSRNPNAIYNNIKPDTNLPPPELWHYYEECDGEVHRIARMTMARGISMHIGSQWFAMPRHVAEWFLVDPLPLSYKDYATHVVVADEHYFSTMLKNSPFCSDLVNKDVNYVIFSKWEQERGNLAKCVQPDPLRCGRSPAYFTRLIKPGLLMAQALFARKFNPDDPDSMQLVSEIEDARQVDADDRRSYNVEEVAEKDKRDAFMIVVSDRRNDQAQGSELFWGATRPLLCLWLPPKWGGEIRAVPCSASDRNQHFVKENCVSIDPFIHTASNYTQCSDGCRIGHLDSSIFSILEGNANLGNTETYCQYRGVLPGKEVEGATEADEFMCLDVMGQSLKPGVPILGYPCTGLWNQYFRLSSDCHLSATQPDAVGIVRGNVDPNNISTSTLCMEVSGEAFGSSPAHAVQGKPCNCTRDVESGTQTFKPFSIRLDMPRDMWVTGGRLHRVKSATLTDEHSSQPTKQVPPSKEDISIDAEGKREVNTEAKASSGRLRMDDDGFKAALENIPGLKDKIKDAITGSRKTEL